MCVEPARHSSSTASSTANYMSKSKSFGPARHSSSTGSLTIKYSYICFDQLIHMLRSMSVEPTQHSSSTASSTANYMSKSKSFGPARHSISTGSLTMKCSYICFDQCPLSQLEIPVQRKVELAQQTLN